MEFIPGYWYTLEDDCYGKYSGKIDGEHTFKEIIDDDNKYHKNDIKLYDDDILESNDIYPLHPHCFCNDLPISHSDNFIELKHEDLIENTWYVEINDHDLYIFKLFVPGYFHTNFDFDSIIRYNAEVNDLLYDNKVRLASAYEIKYVESLLSKNPDDEQEWDIPIEFYNFNNSILMGTTGTLESSNSLLLLL